ncbi:MAG: hypothetical protein ACPGLV_06430 [Bacteroidia bacterium]
MKKYLIFIAICVTTINHSSAQQWDLLQFKKLIEYESQRYLMEDVFEVSNTNFDKLRLEKLITDYDGADGGFLFVLSAYEYNGQHGVVITSFIPTLSNTKFFNTHLPDSQFQEVLALMKSGHQTRENKGIHLIRRINSSLVIEVNKGQYDDYYNSSPKDEFVFWIFGTARHNLSLNKFEKMVKEYEAFK